MDKLVVAGVLVGGAVIGSVIGHYAAKALVKRLPDTFAVFGIRATRRAK